jgi:hypothetical protein
MDHLSQWSADNNVPVLVQGLFSAKSGQSIDMHAWSAASHGNAGRDRLTFLNVSPEA